MTFGFWLIIVYQVAIMATLFVFARSLQPILPRVPIDRSMRVLRIGIWITVLAAFVVGAFGAFNGWLVLTGIAVAFVSILLRAWAIHTLGSQFTCDLRVPVRIVTSGPYKYFRHPAYIGSVGLFTALGLCWGSIWSAGIMLIGTGGLFLWRARLESRDYLSRVPTSAQ